MEKGFDYKDGLRLLVYLKNEEGLTFSMGQASIFRMQFESCRGEGDLIAITRKAYASVPFTHKPRRDSGLYENWLEKFDNAFKQSKIPVLLEDNVDLKDIIGEVDISDYAT
ncbi:hypothetical protein KY306_02975 [Candidatus Woesearchaeota archaeon]|nr:hypothetical protein [Candidatus Woesearchaeota archaeon]